MHDGPEMNTVQLPVELWDVCKDEVCPTLSTHRFFGPEWEDNAWQVTCLC